MAERPDRLLAKCRRQLVTVWAASEEPPPLPPTVRCSSFERLPPISWQQVRQAWATFPARTAIIEGVAPSLVAHASESLCCLVGAFLTYGVRAHRGLSAGAPTDLRPVVAETRRKG